MKIMAASQKLMKCIICIVEMQEKNDIKTIIAKGMGTYSKCMNE